MPIDRLAPLTLPRPAQGRPRRAVAGSPIATGATPRLVGVLIVVAVGLAAVLSAVQRQDPARAGLVEGGALRRTATLSAPASAYVPERFRKMPALYAQSYATSGAVH